MKNIIIKTSLLILSCLIFVQTFAQNQPDINKLITKFGQTLFYINNYYLDSVSNEKLMDNAVKNLLGELDPHSTYISAKDVKAMNEPLEGNFEGVGIEFAIVKDTLTVSSPILGGPSERVGIRAGDKIVTINGEKITGIGLTNDKVYKYLRGPKGTKVMLGVKRIGIEGFFDFEIIRDKIPINSLDAAYEVEPGIVYLKLSRFSATSAKEIIRAIVSLKSMTIRGLILDLRGNSGGFLGTALEISNFFLEAGQTIVYTEGLKVPKMEEKANGTGFYKKGPLALLIDENSASASEIVAGAIQDWDRGIIIGRKSFGKGLVQQMLPLNDGSEIRLTIARYHTPSGRVIQTPYKQGESAKYYKALMDRYSKGEYFTKDSIHFLDSLRFKTLIKGRTVYGGGGIMPDLFVPADTTYYSDYYGILLRKGILLDFMNDYSDANRLIWKKEYTTFEKFKKNFIVDKGILDKLVSYAEERKLETNLKQLEISKKEIAVSIKAMAARTIFGTEAYYKVVNSSYDEIFEKALSYIKSEAGL
ncbi:MAG: S41 family peptidase [Bacteroidales bacterium]